MVLLVDSKNLTTIELALIAAIPLILAQVPGIILALRNGRKIDANTAGQKDIHSLVNGQMGEQKQMTAIAARSLAIADPSDNNKTRADIAEKAYQDHQDQQNNGGK